MLGRILIPVTLTVALFAFGPSASAPLPLAIAPTPSPSQKEPGLELEPESTLEIRLEDELLAARLAVLDGEAPGEAGLWASFSPELDDARPARTRMR